MTAETGLTGSPDDRDDIPIPIVAVVGGQSVGKSSL